MVGLVQDLLPGAHAVGVATRAAPSVGANRSDVAAQLQATLDDAVAVSANFAVEDPPLKLVLIEKPGEVERLNHLGVEADTPEEVTAALARFRGAGLDATLAEQDVCCHAVQDKVFVTAPDTPTGWWEYYAVTDDSPANPDGETTSACAIACEAKAAAVGGTCCT